jgi:nucleoside-diphosphate-sugar epimerase
LAEELRSQINPIAEIVQDDQRLRPANSEVYRLFGSNEKLKQYTGWSPEYSLKDGISATIEWFKVEENIKRYKSDIYNI